MQKFWFSGVALSIPLGILFAGFYLLIKSFFRSMSSAAFRWITPTPADWIVVASLILGTMLMVFMSNVVKKIGGKTDFRPFRKEKSVTDISPDKRKAQNLAPPQEYLSPEPEGLTVGKRGKHYVGVPMLDKLIHILFLGAPGSGKSTILLNLLLWIYNFAATEKKPLSVLAIDCKPELSQKSIFEKPSRESDDSKKHPEIKILSPSKFEGWGFDVFFGLDSSSSDDQLKIRSNMIARSLVPSLSGDNEHFSSNGQKILAGFLMYGFRKGLSFTDSISQIMYTGVPDLIAQVLADPDMESHPKIRGRLQSFADNDSDEFSSIIDTLEKNLDIFDMEPVRYFFDGNPKKATPLDLTDGTSLFLQISSQLLSDYKTIFSLVLELCCRFILSLPDSALSGRNNIILCADEAGVIYLPCISEVVALGRSKHLQAIIACQGLVQLSNLYGDRKAREIVECCRGTVMLSCNDVQTGRDISQRAGQYRETRTSINKKSSVMTSGVDSTSESQSYMPIYDVSDLTALEKHNRVLVIADGSVFSCEKLPYYMIPKYKELSAKIVESNKQFYPDDFSF